jgi:ankyrin repeat protein
MAFTGDLQKARLLLDHGADIDAVDEEYRSTPLGYAARWGQREMAAFLLERGANVNKSGAPWATPLAWAQKKGYTDIEASLRQAGAQ